MTEPAVVLDALMPVGLVRAKLSWYAPSTWCAIQDERGEKSRWSVIESSDLLKQIEPAPAERALGDAIDLERHRALISRSVAAGPYRRHAVVLDGTDVVGVQPRSNIREIVPGIYRDAAPARTHGREIFAWPIITAPTAAARGEAFDLVVTLSRRQHVASAPLRFALDPGTTRFEVEVDIAAVGLDAPKGWRHVLAVDVDAGDVPSLVVPMRVRSDAPSGRVLIHLSFLKDGIVCGHATHVLAVAADKPAGGRAIVSPITLPKSEDEPADLVVTIRKVDDYSATGRYVWSMTSTRAAVDPQPFAVNFGDDPAEFARMLMLEIVVNDARPLLELILRTIGKDIAALIPAAFWDALRSVAAAIASERRDVALLLYSAEEHIPWELAVMDAPMSDAPPFLGAQVALGRWIHSQTSAVPATPPSVLTVKDLAVLAPEYGPRSGLGQLDGAAAEAKYLQTAYDAIAIDATEREVLRMLAANVARHDGSLAAINVVHFACHGSSDPTRPGYSRVFLADDRPLTPRVFGATELGSRFNPVLFINACEVGMGERLLANEAGFAGISLRGGFRAFIAPIWAVSDEVAGDVAHRFYDATLGADARPVGVALRDIRRSFAGSEQATLLSYIYYGHPRLRLQYDPPARRT